MILNICNQSKDTSHSDWADRYPPNAENNLQQSANARDEEDGADEVALREAIVLQTQPLRQD